MILKYRFIFYKIDQFILFFYLFRQRYFFILISHHRVLCIVHISHCFIFLIFCSILTTSFHLWCFDRLANNSLIVLLKVRCFSRFDSFTIIFGYITVIYNL